MVDREPADAVDRGAGRREGDDSADEGSDDSPGESESLRDAVEAKYDFDRFGPADMAEMTVEEWEAAFDADAWITGPRLIDRVDDDLRARVAAGELFAVIERHSIDAEPRLLVYSDAEYAVVHADGTVEGEGSLRREVEPVVALCSMDSYEVTEPPADASLPDPVAVEPGSGDLGHRLLLVLAGSLAVAGLVVLASPVLVRLGPGAGALTTVVGLAFLLVGVLLGVLVANARLSDRFRAAEYRDRLRAAGVGSDERPSFLPPMDGREEESEPSDPGGS